MQHGGNCVCDWHYGNFSCQGISSSSQLSNLKQRESARSVDSTLFLRPGAEGARKIRDKGLVVSLWHSVMLSSKYPAIPWHFLLLFLQVCNLFAWQDSRYLLPGWNWRLEEARKAGLCRGSGGGNIYITPIILFVSILIYRMLGLDLGIADDACCCSPWW